MGGQIHIPATNKSILITRLPLPLYFVRPITVVSGFLFLPYSICLFRVHFVRHRSSPTWAKNFYGVDILET
jgi:hypothetical protein